MPRHRLNRRPRSPQNLFDLAIEHVTSRVPLAQAEDVAGKVRDNLAGHNYDCASVIVVCQGKYFTGLVRLERLLAASADTVLASLIDAHAPTVRPEAEREAALWQAVQHGGSVLSLVDADNVFIGLIPPERLLAVLLQEHDEDLARLGGFLRQSTTARMASVESIPRRFWHRVPWLVLGLVGALFAADLIGYFETALEAKLLLAFFMPGIVYLADAVGTQTETVVVRGLSVGVKVGRIVWLELVTGLLIGLSLALLAGPFIWWRWGDADVAWVVACAIFSACSVATVIAMLFPTLFSRFHVDPAFGSGPLATVAQDLLSILLYFLIASAILL